MNTKNTQLIVFTVVFFVVTVASGFLFFKYLSTPSDSLVQIEKDLQSYQVELEKCKTITTDKNKAVCEKYISQIEVKLKAYEIKLGQIKKTDLSATVNLAK